MERISLSRLRKDPWPPSKARALRRPQHLEPPARGGAGLYVLRHRRLADGFALTRPPAASIPTRRSSDALPRHVSYVSCISWCWGRAVSVATSARSSSVPGIGG